MYDTTTMDALYENIGAGYSLRRRPDPRIARAIWRLLGDAHSVANIGAGTGAYEPPDRAVIAIEPSAVMIAQRAAGSAQVIQAQAERLPLADRSVDAAMAVFSDHHWADRPQGLRELRRVARDRVLLVNGDPVEAARFWLTREYLPGVVELVPERFRTPGAWEDDLRAQLGDIRLHPVPVRHDCVDGFYQAYWRRPTAYLQADVRDSISVFHRLPASQVDDAVGRLRADLESGAWRERHRDLMARTELDVGLRIIVAELDG